MDSVITDKEKKSDIQQVSRRNPLLLLTLLLNTALMGAIVFFQYKSFQKEAKEADAFYDLVRSQQREEKDEQLNDVSEGDFQSQDRNEPGILLPLQGFTVNLAQDKGPRRYIRLSTVLKFSSDSKENEFRAKRPQIRDSIISILNSKKPSDLLEKEGKDYLKEEIKSSINSFLVDGKVVDIYYVGFQIN